VILPASEPRRNHSRLRCASGETGEPLVTSLDRGYSRGRAHVVNAHSMAMSDDLGYDRLKGRESLGQPEQGTRKLSRLPNPHLRGRPAGYRWASDPLAGMGHSVVGRWQLPSCSLSLLGFRQMLWLAQDRASR
jgi:hypothetical protein